MVRKGRPSASRCATAGVSAWAAAFCGRVALCFTQLVAAALGVPGLPLFRPGVRLGLEVFGQVALDVRVRAWISGLLGACCGAFGDRVVDIKSRLLPGVEDDLLVGVVGVQRGDDALHRIVEQDRTDAGVGHVLLGLVEVRGAEEGLVLPDRLALVVEDRAAGADPAGLGCGLHQLALCIALQLAGQISPVAVGTATSRWGATPGSAWIFFWISRPKPSE